MRKIKIVADSSSDVLSLGNVEFASAPLKIITAEGEFTDDASLDTREMVEFFDKYKGKSSTSCPNTGDWLNAFGDADDIFCVTITSGLSGSYNSACVAKQMFEAQNRGKRVFVIDSLSAGPELRLIIEKLAEFISADMDYENICKKITEYQKKTGLFFMLKSMKNLANNGRVSHVVAKIAGLVGIHVVGKASEQGTLEQTNKCPGEARALGAIVSHLEKLGLLCGKVRIAHCFNESAALKLKEMILAKFEQVKVEIHKCGGLCSFYAEKGGMLVGFEKI